MLSAAVGSAELLGTSVSPLPALNSVLGPNGKYRWSEQDVYGQQTSYEDGVGLDHSGQKSY
jgi:hypothetical protein